MLLGLRTCVYHTPDLAAGKEWYAKAVGHPPYFDEPFYVGFAVGGFELGLVPDGDGPAGRGMYWGVSDIDAELARLLALGATPAEPIQDVGGGIRAATVTDPFGNRIGLIENPHFDPKKVT